jgi:hypothetical protein
MCAFAIIALVFSAMFILPGMIPCLVPLNFVGVPAALLALVLGLVGLLRDRDPVTHERQNAGTYGAVLFFGALLMLLGIWRVQIGGGIL